VAGAIAAGGPGAVLWCWLTGVFGIATKYSEGLLAVKYRVKTEDGTMLGGPMYALERGLKMKWLAIIFAVFAALAAFGIGSTTQAESLTQTFNAQFGVNPLLSSIIITILVALVIIGGVKSIAKVCTVLVPFMAIFYVLGCLIILIINASFIGPAITLIIKSAFTAKAVGGGIFGAGIMAAARYGVARGLFSNESGLGSAPIAAAAAMTRNPVRQALVSMTGTFWDTVIVCLMTGLTLVSSILKYPATFMQNGELVFDKSQLTTTAFAQIHTLGPVILTIGLATFVFSTILGWSYYGERCVEYLFGKNGIVPYKIIYTLTAFLGGIIWALGTSNSFTDLLAGLFDSVQYEAASSTLKTLIWDLADLLNGLMAIPNLIALLLLSGVIVAETKKYLDTKDGLHIKDDTPIPVRRSAQINRR